MFIANQTLSLCLTGKRTYHYITPALHLMHQSAVFKSNQLPKSNITGCWCSSDLISELGSVQQTLQKKGICAKNHKFFAKFQAFSKKEKSLLQIFCEVSRVLQDQEKIMTLAHF